MGHVARVRIMKNSDRVLVGNVMGKQHLQDVGVDGRIVLKLIVEKSCGRVWFRFLWLELVNTVMSL